MSKRGPILHCGSCNKPRKVSVPRCSFCGRTTLQVIAKNECDAYDHRKRLELYNSVKVR